MEGFGFCILGAICLLVIFAMLFLGAILASTGGLTGLLVSKGRGCSGKISTGLVFIGIIDILLLIGVAWLAMKTFVRPTHNISDEVVQPYLSALEKVDRTSLGFTPISANARIGIEYASSGRVYDVMLHIYAETSRTIAFKENADGSYEWIGEQEIFTGPRQFETADGINNEKIFITYDKVRISGAPTNQVYIMYYGDDPRLDRKFNLTLQDIQPILNEWRTISKTPVP